ncbi:hypothetical protein [Rhodopirellula europaea]|uniref:hypothetical protein n=1 Tax=Rhodopirellula europaea TaxID=1263866 RepID=UPI001181C38A|nr:hypothetical protein [Rhodopirellula europaea]
MNNADELLAAIAEAASPSDGTNDSQTGQDAAAEALQYLLEQDKNANLLDLDTDQREIVLERFLAVDAFKLFATDVCKHMQNKGPLAEHQNRMRVLKDYFCETFRQANQRRAREDRPSLGRIPDDEVRRVSRSIITEAYMIFEGFFDES